MSVDAISSARALGFVLALACPLAGCALGVGATTSADPRAHDDVAVGVSGGAALAYTRVAPADEPSAGTYGWNFRGGALAMHRGFGGALEYESRYEEGDYAGGFGTMLRSRALMLYGAWTPVPGLGLDLGGGYIHGGKLGFGGRGNVLGDDAASISSAGVTGFRQSLRVSWMPIGGGSFGSHTVYMRDRWTGRGTVGTRIDLPLSTTLQLEWTNAWVSVGSGAGLPAHARTMSLSAALVFSLF